jgi:hypothetical protein
VLANQDIDALWSRLLALAAPASPGRITVRRVIEVMAEHFGATVDALLSPNAGRSRCASSPNRNVRRPQGDRAKPPLYRPHMGDRDRTTILHGRRAVQRLVVTSRPVVDEQTRDAPASV